MSVELSENLKNIIAAEAGGENQPPAEAPAVENKPVETAPVEEQVEEHTYEPSEQAEPETPETETETEAGSGEEAWVDQELLALAATYGVDDPRQEFNSKEEFLRFAKHVDNHNARFQRQQQQAAEAAPVKEADRPGVKEGKVDLEYFRDPENNFNEETIQAMELLRETQDRVDNLQESRDAMLNHIMQQEQVRQMEAFHSAVDKLTPELYGATIDAKGNYIPLKEGHGARRVQLLEEINNVILPSIQRQERLTGKPIPYTYDSLVRRASLSLHGDDLKRIETSKRAEKLKKQSAQRRPATSPAQKTRPTYAPTGDKNEDVAQQIMAEPAFQEVLGRIRSDNGLALSR